MYVRYYIAFTTLQSQVSMISQGGSQALRHLTTGIMQRNSCREWVTWCSKAIAQDMAVEHNIRL